MKKLCMMLMLTAFSGSLAVAQEVTTTSTEGDNLVYWEDPAANNQYILNSNKFGDNWFLGLHVGSFYSWGTGASHASFFKQFRPAGAISLGKWFAPALGARVQVAVGGNRSTNPEHLSYKWGTGGAYLDALVNFNNLFGGYREGRPFNLIGVFGVGGDRTFSFSDKSWNAAKAVFDDESANYFALRAGLMAKFRLNYAWDFDIEAVNTWVDDAFDGRNNWSKDYWDGHINVFLGFTYRFKNHDGAHMFTYATYDRSAFDDANARINALRAMNEDLARQQAAMKPEVRTVTKEGTKIQTLISFADGKADINQLQEVNVYTAGQAFKSLPSDGELYITVNGEMENRELFLQRAQAIRDLLVNNYGIAAGRVFIEQNPAIIRNFDAGKNCVVVYINE